MIKIADIEKGSQAEEAGLLPGDKLLEINGETVRDRLDFEFYRTEPEIQMRLLRDDAVLEKTIHRQYGRNLGVVPEIMKIHICKNNCVFCFVYQNPKGMRKSMYVKDEDYRYSFLDGHFTTLSNMGQEDWDRVLQQKLSPLYVSVHATDHEVRGRLLGNTKLEPILNRLAWFRENDLQFHTQLVVVPGWNDGEVLVKSLEDLMEFFPALMSISVVPIGLTGFREKLPNLKTFDKQMALNCIDLVHRYNKICEEKFGENFIFCSDEMYVVGEAPLPPPEYYGDFSQYENGIGTLTSLLMDFKSELESLPTAPPDWKITVLTAPLARPTLKIILDELKIRKGLQAELVEVDNLTFGSSVTVTGLLCGADFSRAIENATGKGPVCLPPNSLNEGGAFLDDLTPAEVQKKTGRQIVVPNSFRDFFPNEPVT